MKRLLAILLLFLLCIGGASATSQFSSNFQTITNTQSWYYSPAPPYTATWQIPAISQWQYYYKTYSNAMYVSGWPYSEEIRNSVANPTTYAAATYWDWYGAPTVTLYDNSGNYTLYGPINLQPSFPEPQPTRYEMKMIGGQAYFYENGIFLFNSPILTQNPAYVGWGGEVGFSYSGYNYAVDDIIDSSTDPTWILGLPDESTEVIYKDLINPSNYGIAFANNHTVVSSYNMTGSFGRSTIGSNASQTVVLRSWSSAVPNTNYGTAATGTAGAGIIQWPVYDDIINNPNAPYGEYYETVDGTSAISNTIAYIGGGATVSWDSPSHSPGDTAQISYAITSGGYWNPLVYSYQMSIANIYGQFLQNTSLQFQNSNVSYKFPSSANGVYYAELWATPIAGGEPVLMTYAATTVSTYVNFHGYVNNAQTGAIISGANISFNQGNINLSTTSAADGNYTLSGFITGAAVAENDTAAGFRQFIYTFTPATAKTVSLNISMVPTNPAKVATAIGGVDRDATYGNPIQGATVTVTNTSTGEDYLTSTSMTGWYLCDSGATCSISYQRPYNVWASDSGYVNSTTYQVIPL